MADVKVHLGKRPEAVAVLREGLKHPGTPGYAGILFDLTNACISDHKLSEAEKFIAEMKGIRIPPQDAPLVPLAGYLECPARIGKKGLEASRGYSRRYRAQADRLPRHPENGICLPRPMLPSKGQPRKGARCLFGGRKNRSVSGAGTMATWRHLHEPEQPAAAAEQFRILASANPSQVDAAISYARILIMIQLREDKEKRNWDNVDKLLDQVEQKSR